MKNKYRILQCVWKYAKVYCVHVFHFLAAFAAALELQISCNGYRGADKEWCFWRARVTTHCCTVLNAWWQCISNSIWLCTRHTAMFSGNYVLPIGKLCLLPPSASDRCSAYKNITLLTMGAGCYTQAYVVWLLGSRCYTYRLLSMVESNDDYGRRVLYTSLCCMVTR